MDAHAREAHPAILTERVERAAGDGAGDACEEDALAGLKHKGRAFGQPGNFEDERFHANQARVEITAERLLGRDERRVGQAGVLVRFGDDIFECDGVAATCGEADNVGMIAGAEGVGGGIDPERAALS